MNAYRILQNYNTAHKRIFGRGYSCPPEYSRIFRNKPVGASLFGIVPLYTVISHVKRVPAGRTVSYDCSYTAQETEWITTLPIGYADGWFRGYQGMQVFVDGMPALIVGHICMNQTLVRLPKYFPIGTKVTLIGSEISIEQLASHIGSIPQQVLTLIPGTCAEGVFE